MAMALDFRVGNIYSLAVGFTTSGAAEVLLTSVDRDGMRDGYDFELLQAVRAAVSVPLVASGGVEMAAHVMAALSERAADAALVAGIVHDGVATTSALKTEVAAAQIPLRLELAV